MPDYKQLYLTMMRETEKAIRILIHPQQACEELYLKSSEDDQNPLTQPPQSDIV